MRNFVFCQPLLFYPVCSNGLKHIAQQNIAPLGSMLDDKQLLYKDRIGVRGVKVISRNKINPFLRRQVKTVLIAPVSVNPGLKQIVSTRIATQPERIKILNDVRIQFV